jgi:tRNA dimethylallyltransferase
VPTGPLQRAIYLTGPTAVGKTAVAIALAHRLGAEVIALDSMTLYRGMDIGTAKPTAAQRSAVPHHLIDVLDPWESASVATYRHWALDVAADVDARGKQSLFVGGTPLYLKALLRGLFEGPTADPELRAFLEAEALRWGDLALHARLNEIDPATAARLHPHNRRRIIRALEVLHATGRPLCDWQSEHDRPAIGTRVFALDRRRAELHERIDRRVVEMFAAGFVDEVRVLASGPRPMGTTASQAVGYREVLDHLAGRAGLAETIERVQVRTRQFAKRQATWFRGLAEVEPCPIAAGETADITARRLAARIERGS